MLNLFKNMSWLIVANAFWRSIKIIPITKPPSKLYYFFRCFRDKGFTSFKFLTRTFFSSIWTLSSRAGTLQGKSIERDCSLLVWYIEVKKLPNYIMFIRSMFYIGSQNRSGRDQLSIGILRNNFFKNSHAVLYFKL